jgi:hypothetical protein
MRDHQGSESRRNRRTSGRENNCELAGAARPPFARKPCHFVDRLGSAASQPLATFLLTSKDAWQ